MITHTTHRDQFSGYDGKIYSNDVLNNYGTAECQSFRDLILSKYTALAPSIRAEYLSIATKKSSVHANLRLLNLDHRLTVGGFNVLFSYDATTEFANNQAVKCRRLRTYASELEDIYSSCSELARSYGITPPLPKNFNDQIEPCLNRLCCEKWWKRKLQKLQNITVESVSRDLRQVHDHKSLYCSNISLWRHQQQKINTRDFLETQVAVNQDNQEFTLAELSDLGVSNPSIRRTELITRCKGFEVIAKESNHDALFLTLTTPSRFHRMTKITNKGKTVKVIPNKKYEELTPRDAQDYLINTWARIQAKLSRESIKPYGFRVAEPHHDGTPHWHFMLFIDKKDTSNLISIFKQWALKDSPDENGAKEYRFKVVFIKTGINPSTGNEYSATGYLIKYICKNIDGHGINNNEKTASGKDWAGKNPYEIAERIEAWARTYRIRQFQQIGGPSVTVWRELRRLSEQEGSLEEMRQAADNGDWAAFTKAMGGANLKRNDYKVRPVYAKSETLDRSTGEITKVIHTVYGDEAKDRVVGLLIAGVTILSRTDFWEIKDNHKVQCARKKIMHGIVDLLDEIADQNNLLVSPLSLLPPPQAKPEALDLFQ